MSIRQRVFAYKCLTIGMILFGLAFIGTGLQHFIYLQFVATLVPGYIPVPVFWAALTGTAMILAGVSFILKRRANLSALLLSIMMGCFVVMIHLPKLSAAPRDINNWVRALQDIAILGTAMMLTTPKTLTKVGLWLYAIPLLLLGLVHFMQPVIVTAKIPAYFPVIPVFDVIIGLLMTGLTLCIIIKRYAMKAALALGTLLLIFALLYSVPILVGNIKTGGEWTNLLLAMAVSAGGFVAAAKIGK